MFASLVFFVGFGTYDWGDWTWMKIPIAIVLMWLAFKLLGLGYSVQQSDSYTSVLPLHVSTSMIAVRGL